MLKGDRHRWALEYRRRNAVFLCFVMKVWSQVVARLPADAHEDAITKCLVGRLDADTRPERGSTAIISLYQ